MKAPKPTKAMTKHLTKKDKNTRVEIESKIQLGTLTAEAPAHYPPQRKAIYKFLYDNLMPSGFFGTLDALTIDQACVIIDRLQAIDRQIDAGGDDLLTDRLLRQARVDYFKQFLNMCSELCLSPAGRAKLGALVANTKPADPLNDLLGGDGK